MTDKEINRYIHREIMQICQSPDPECDCVPADYTSDDSPRRLLNEVVAKFRVEEIGETLREVMNVRRDGPRANVGLALRATAEQIARACVEAHKLTAKPAA